MNNKVSFYRKTLDPLCLVVNAVNAKLPYIDCETGGAESRVSS